MEILRTSNDSLDISNIKDEVIIEGQINFNQISISEVTQKEKLAFREIFQDAIKLNQTNNE